MEYHDLDRVLEAALSPSACPSEALNNKIIGQIKESSVMRLRNRKIVIAACAAACLLLIPVSAYAAYKYLTPKEAAIEMNDSKLGEAFVKDGKEVLQTVTDGLYTVAYLGHVSGEDISERAGSAWKLYPERTYVAVAVEKTDGTDMTYEDNLFVSPLIQGLKPWSYNIASMHGGYESDIIDGVLYRIIECDNVEVFADKKLYLAVSDTVFYSKDAFDYDEETGLITPSEAYNGTNILFPLELDPSKADQGKADAYIKQLEEEETSESNKQEEAVDEEALRTQQEVFEDKENGITFHVSDNDSSSWSAGNSSAETVFSYHFKVEGEGIEALTYTLNNGEFCNYSSTNPDESKFFGNKYSLSYEDQSNIDYNYSIMIRADYADFGYDADELSKLGEKDIDARDSTYFDILNKQVEATEIKLEIQMKDGRVIEKNLSLDNVLDGVKELFWITIKVS